MANEQEQQPEVEKSAQDLAYEKEMRDKEQLIAVTKTPGGQILLDGATSEAEGAIFTLISTYRNTTVNDLLANIAKLEANLKIISTLTGAENALEATKILVEGMKQEK